MRLALLTDLHANREAFEACLAHAERQSIDQYAFTGDFVGYGADPAWVVQTVMDYVGRGAVAVQGNHDYAVTRAVKPQMHMEAREVIEWTRGQLDAQMAVVTQDFRRDYPHVVGKELVMSFLPYQMVTGLEVRSYLFLLLGAIGFLLLIACANVSNLLLSRAIGRKREFALRSALGATRAQLMRQTLTESVLLALCGGMCGVTLAYFTTQIIVALGALVTLAVFQLVP